MQSSASEKSKSPVKRRFYFDFDGTLTKLPGEVVVTDSLYGKLMVEDNSGYQLFLPETINELNTSTNSLPGFIYFDKIPNLTYFYYKQNQGVLERFNADVSIILKNKIYDDADDTAEKHLDEIQSDLESQSKKLLTIDEAKPIIDEINNCIEEINHKITESHQKISSLPSYVFPYSNGIFKPENDLVSLLEDEEYEDFRVSKKTINFLIEILNSDDEIVVVSRNRKEYIRAILLASGLPEELLNKIIIYDVKYGNKSKAVRDHEEKYGSANHTIICDDKKSDAHAMFNSVFDAKLIDTFICKPGKFNWKKVKETISASIASNQGNCLFQNSFNDYNRLLSLAPNDSEWVSILRDSGEKGYVFYETFQISNGEIKKQGEKKLHISDLQSSLAKKEFAIYPRIDPSDDLASKQFFLTKKSRLQILKSPATFALTSIHPGKEFSEATLSDLRAAQTIIISPEKGQTTEQLLTRLPKAGEKWVFVMGNGTADVKPSTMMSQSIFQSNLDISCSVKEYGDLIIQARPNTETTINILLNVNNGGETYSEKGSFAVQLASYLAEKGYKSTIIASKTAVGPFDMPSNDDTSCKFNVHGGPANIVVVKGGFGVPVTEEYNLYPNGFSISSNEIGKKEVTSANVQKKDF